MSEILEGPVERIIVETKEAPAPVGPYSQVGGNFKRKYKYKEANTIVMLQYMKFNLECFLAERENIFAEKQAWKKSISSRFSL
jgi:hypothetical protein